MSVKLRYGWHLICQWGLIRCWSCLNSLDSASPGAEVHAKSLVTPESLGQNGRRFDQFVHKPWYQPTENGQIITMETASNLGVHYGELDKTVCFVALDVHIRWLLIPSAACQLVVLVCALFVAVAEK